LRLDISGLPEASRDVEGLVEMINILLGDFIGKMHSSKWAKMTNVHRDTARRDIFNLPALLEPAKFKAEESTW
jgi:Fic family protein